LRSNVSDAQINRGWVTLSPNLGVFPLQQTRHFGVAKRERPRLTNGEIIYFRRIPTYVITIHQRHRRTYRRTDRQTDRRHAIAIPRGKNSSSTIIPLYCRALCQCSFTKVDKKPRCRYDSQPYCLTAPLGSHDVIGHDTPCVISYWWSFGTKPLS